MRSLRSILSMVFTLVCISLHAQVDTSRFAGLDRNLDGYFLALEGESVASKLSEVDFMLSSCDEGEVRDHVALRIYDHYLNSPLMGDESVAVHVVDDWFVPGKAKMTNDIDFLNARIYAEFNRRSLLGCRAPSLKLRTPEEEVREALGVVSDSLAGGSSRLRILFIYDTDCTKCRLETVMLSAMFRQTDYPVDFIAVYSGDNREAWDSYRSGSLDFHMEKARIFHYWDPEIESDFQKKYGVLQTPRMFLIGKDGTIIGRNLDTQALMSLLEMYAVEPQLSYGSKESMELFSSLLPEDDLSMAADSVRSVADYIAKRTLEDTRDTVSFRQLTGDMLYYLAGKRGEAFVYGSDYVAGTMVLDRPDIWTSEDDSLKVIGLARMIKDVVAMAPVGSRMPKIRVHGTMLSGRGSVSKVWNLAKLRDGDYVLFHTSGCEICKAEIAAAQAIMAERKLRILLVDTDEISSADRPLMETLLGTFDLTSLPFELQVGKGHRVARKYTSLVGK